METRAKAAEVWNQKCRGICKKAKQCDTSQTEVEECNETLKEVEEQCASDLKQKDEQPNAQIEKIKVETGRLRNAMEEENPLDNDLA